MFEYMIVRDAAKNIRLIAQNSHKSVNRRFKNQKNNSPVRFL